MRKRHWMIAAALAVTLTVVWWQIGRRAYLEEEKVMRTRFREAVQNQFPATSDRLAAEYGLNPYPHTPHPGDSSTIKAVLLHGLDEPGKVWLNLAPALASAGFPVWVMTYPNDQPIADSADLLLSELHQLPGRDVAIIAHSMGGLVAREMLTNPKNRYLQEAAKGSLPRVRLLVMVGTPNHGSELARFQMLTEFRDQFAGAFTGDHHWLRWILDGAGEAGIDLLPRSRFLTALNRRPPPEGVRMLVIAGAIGPVETEERNTLIEGLEAVLPSSAKGSLEEFEKWLLSVSSGLGDGLVSLASTRLAGASHRTVAGTHLSIIRNIRSGSTRIPPAVPLILAALENRLPGE